LDLAKLTTPTNLTQNEHWSEGIEKAGLRGAIDEKPPILTRKKLRE